MIESLRICVSLSFHECMAVRRGGDGAILRVEHILALLQLLIVFYEMKSLNSNSKIIDKNADFNNTAFIGGKTTNHI